MWSKEEQPGKNLRATIPFALVFAVQILLGLWVYKIQLDQQFSDKIKCELVKTEVETILRHAKINERQVDEISLVPTNNRSPRHVNHDYHQTNFGPPGPQGPPGAPGPQGPKGLPGKCECASKQELPSIINYPNQYLPQRVDECVITQIGRGVPHEFSRPEFGSFLLDTVVGNEKYWSIVEDVATLNEYANGSEDSLRTYTLNPPAHGVSQVIHNNQLFYHVYNTRTQMARFSLTDGTVKRAYVPRLTEDNSEPLYRNGYEFLDFGADENGLWAVFVVPETKKLGVMKVNPETLDMEYIWHTNEDSRSVNGTFLASGVLYAIDDTKISFGLDLYTQKYVQVDATIEKFGWVSTATYDHLNKRLWVLYDSSDVVYYPVTCEKPLR